MRSLPILAVVAALAFAAPASADPDAPPLEGGVTCHQKIKRKLPLAKVMRHGLPVKITCDGPAKLLVAPDFDAMTKASQELAHTHPGIPPVAGIKRATLAEAGTITLRPRFNKIGKAILRHHKRTRIIVGLGTLRTDGRYWSGPDDWSYTTLVR